MKLNLLCALLAVSQGISMSANAQSSTAVIPTIMPSNTTVSTGDAVGVANPNAPKLKIKYFAIMSGPGLEFSGARQAAIYDHSALTLQSRPKFLLQTSENFDFGLEARFSTAFGAEYNKGSNVKVSNDTYRLVANIKNVIKTETVSVAIIPRVALPTSNKNHDQHLRLAPEFVTSIDIAPKNSRFSFNTGLLYQYGIYGTDTTGANYTKPATSVFQPWLETDYQVSPKVQGFLAYWPEFTSFARKGSPLAADSNEVDLGAYIQVAKGWQVAPYVSLEPQGMDSHRVDRAMQLNLYLIGSVL